jgi:hypothetical protein
MFYERYWLGFKEALKTRAAVASAIVFASMVLFAAPYLFLEYKRSASALQSNEIKKDWPNPDTKSREPRQKYPEDQKIASFGFLTLIKTTQSPINAHYSVYAGADTWEKPSDWGREFWCGVKATDIAISNLTAFLILVTGGLWWSTHRLWRAGDDQLTFAQQVAERQAEETKAQLSIAKTAADSALLQAKAAINVDLPVLHLKNPALTRTNRDSSGSVGIIGYTDLPESCTVCFDVGNIGRSYAELLTYCIEHKICIALPDAVDYKLTFPLSADTIVKADGQMRGFPAYNLQLSKDELEPIKSGRSFLWVYGFINYFDFMGDLHEKRFCLKWLAGGPERPIMTGFVVDPLTPHTYVKGY